MGKWVWGCGLFFVLPSVLSAAILVETKPSQSADGVRQALESGAWDNYQLNFPVVRDEVTTRLPLTRAAFTALSPENQDAIAKGLSEYYNGNGGSYQAWVYTQQNDLKAEPAMVRLGVPFETIAASVWAEALLSVYAQKWAKKWSTFDGPNCYHTSMASIFTEWTAARYMGPQELLCHQRTYFDPIEKLEQWGDMVSLDDAAGVPIHAFTYLGADRAHPEKKIVFTKNGYRVSPFLYMTYDDVYAAYSAYGIASAKFYRPKKDAKAIDPKDHPDAPCYNYFAAGQWAKPAGPGDALLEYRLRTRPMAKVTPVHLK